MLDAFRHRHHRDTFWCGLLLGGYGAQLTTKLYTDRVCHPLPFNAGPLQRLYGNLTRMIAERKAADGPVHTNRASMSVRMWETSDGQLDATLTRRKGTTVATLTFPIELDRLQQLHDKVVARMKACKVAQRPWRNRSTNRGKV
ncbi:hypothetical protein ACM614_00175 [Streptomyces sp. 12297]